MLYVVNVTKDDSLSWTSRRQTHCLQLTIEEFAWRF